ncbi:MAG TPA: GAF domain-containing protein [Anaerolineales bacterium]|nr:GAF domain-containing protein [Anaerolineales bacterium]HNS60222.1 GAF domain-containing protein [Anaerolineales bacterium]
MNEIKQPAQSHKDEVSPVAFWGTLALAVIDLLLCPYMFSMLSQQTGSPVTYAAMTVFLLATLTALISLALTLRRRQGLAAKFLFGVSLIIGITAVTLFQDRTLDASLSILLIAFMMIRWLFPDNTPRRPYYVIAFAAFLAMWVIEWIAPSWRTQFNTPTLGPAVVITFAVILSVMAFLQVRTVIANRFLSFSLRAKLLISIVSITGLALLAYGIIFLYRTQQSQAFWSSELQNTVQQQSQQQILDSTRLEANTADQSLSQVTLAVQQLADYRASLFASQSMLGQGGLWDGNSQLERLPGGQYGNASTDLAAIFIPNLVSLSPSIIADLNTSMYLDFSAPKILEENPNIVAVYYDSADNYTVYYPNINLADLVPPDFDPSAQPFYTIATPQNDPERKPVWTAPYQDPAGTGLIVTNSIPVYDQNNRFRGVMSADIQLSKITEQLSAVKVGQSGFAFLIDPSGYIIAMPDVGYELFGLEPEIVPVNESPKTTILGLGATDFQNITQKMVNGEQGLATATIQDTSYYIAYYPLPTIGYSIGLIAPTSELDAGYLAARDQINQQTQSTFLLSIMIFLIVLLVVGGISLMLGQFLATPLTQLTETAKEVSKGNLNVRAEVQTRDEIGTLASTFNIMTDQLKDLIGSLEQRVADRTRNLALAAEVGRSVSQVRALDVMLKDACELILKEFNLYYVQVYLTDPGASNLRLEAGTGSVGAQLVGRGHSLPLNTGSINGRAATEKNSVVIPDTSRSATFRQNPLLPETRGEMAVPLIVADKVVGVLDMQSSQPGVLTEEILPAFEALAGQLAVAVQNANLLAETEEARAEVEKQARRLVRQGWNEHLDAIHKPEQLGFVFDHNNVAPLSTADESQLSENGKAVSAPIAVTGESLGSLVVELDDEVRAEQTSRLVDIVARQVAQQIENLRLLESAERYRYEAEEASRRLTREGWKSYAEKAGGGLQYIYDSNEVRPLNGDNLETAAAIPLKVRDEVVGKVAVQGLDTNDTEALNLASTVAERLSSHIEGLRQFEQTQSSLAETQTLYRINEAIGGVTELDLIYRTVAKLSCDELGFTGSWIAVYNPTNETLQGVAGENMPVERITASLSINDATPATLAAKTRHAVMVNNPETDERMQGIPPEVMARVGKAFSMPVMAGQELLGVIAVTRHRNMADLGAREERMLQAIATQLAIVMQRVKLFEQVRKQAEREAMLNVINQKIQSATSVEAVLQIAARELGTALGAPMTVAQLSLKDKTS